MSDIAPFNYVHRQHDSDVGELRDRELEDYLYSSVNTRLTSNALSTALPTQNLQRGQRVFMTDTGGTFVYYGATTLWQRPWEEAWGTVGSASVASDQGSITGTLVDITSVTVTFTALGNRNYRVTGVAQVKTTVANDHVDIRLCNAANTVISGGLVRLQAITVGLYYTATIVGFNTPGAGSVTYKMRAVVDSGAGTATIGGASVIPTTILVEDAGPVGNAPAS